MRSDFHSDLVSTTLEQLAAALARVSGAVATALVAELYILSLVLPGRPPLLHSILGQKLNVRKTGYSRASLPVTTADIPWRLPSASGVERLRAHWAGWVSDYLSESEPDTPRLAGLIIYWCQDRMSWTIQCWKADAVGSRVIQFIRALPDVLPLTNNRQQRLILKVIWLHVRLLQALQYLELEPLRRMVTLCGLLAAQLAFGRTDKSFFHAEKRLCHLLARQVDSNNITTGLSAHKVMRIYRELVRLRSLYRLSQTTLPPILDTVLYKLEHLLTAMILSNAGLVTFDGGDCDASEQIRHTLAGTPAYQEPDRSRYMPALGCVRLVGQSSTCVLRVHETAQSIWSPVYRASGAVEFARHETHVLVTPQSYRDTRLYRSTTSAAAHNTIVLDKCRSSWSQTAHMDYVAERGDTALRPQPIAGKDRHYSYTRHDGLAYRRYGLSYIRELQLCEKGLVLLGKDTLS